MSRIARDRGVLADLGNDDTGCHILHIDMDAFYVAVELLSAPQLRGCPVIVGGHHRAVVLSASYEARRFGVRAAMSMTQALRLCPAATIIEPHHDAYFEISSQVMQIFQEVTDQVEPLSLDEAFIDVAGAIRRLGSPASIAAQIRERVATLGVTCSAGVARNKLLAKIASQYAKPDGLVVIPCEASVQFLHRLPVNALWGVGEKTEKSLQRLGIYTIGDLAQLPPDTLKRSIGCAAGEHLHQLAWGHDDQRVVSIREEKSIGAEQTFSYDVTDDATLSQEMLWLSQKVAMRLRNSSRLAGKITVKIKYADFSVSSKAVSLPQATDVAHTIYELADAALRQHRSRRLAVRLLGVRAESLQQSGSEQLQLNWQPRPQGWREAEQAMDEAIAKFGDGALRPAALLTRVSHRQDQPTTPQ